NISSVLSGAREVMFNGFDWYTTIWDGGSLLVSGGSAKSTYVNDGLLTVQQGGVTLGTTLAGSSTETVRPGGFSSLTTVGPGALDDVWGRSIKARVDGGRMTVHSGGVAYSTTMGGIEVVSSGGTVGANVVGGTQTLRGALATGNRVFGLEFVSSG